MYVSVCSGNADSKGAGQLRQKLRSTGIAGATSACSILLAMGGLVLRWWVLRIHMARVEPDKAKVEEVWAQLVRDAQARSVLQQVEVLIGTPATTSGEPLRYPGSDPSSSVSSVRRGVDVLRHMCLAQEPGLARQPPADRQVTVTCLDQLYFQAAVVTPMFIVKVRKWAACAAGSLPARRRAPTGPGGLTDSPPLVRSDQPQHEADFDCAPMLDPVQATHDAILKCHGDPSRMINIVREVIVFDSFDDQLQCLEELRGDADVTVVGIINRQPLATEVTEYVKPCIRVYVTLNTAGAQEMAVSGHICQLDLILKPIWRVFVDPATQSRYRTYRECVYAQTPGVSCVGRWFAARRCGRGTARDAPAGCLSLSNRVYPQEANSLEAVEGRRTGLARGMAANGSMMEEGRSIVDVGWNRSLRPEGVGTHGGNTGMELQGAELQVLTCDGPAGRAGNEGEGAFNTMHERVSREQIEDFFGCSGVECGAGASSGGCAIQTFGEGRHNKVVLTKGSCGFAALLLDRLVEGHETISNVYFAAGLDDRLRYICLCGGVQEDQLPE